MRVGHRVSCARDASEAMAVVSAEPLDLVLCDVRMPGIHGLELVRQIHDLQPDLPCIVITGYGSAEASVDALRAGAFWYLEKPFEQASLDVVRRLVDQAIEHGRLKAENRLLQRQLRTRYRFENIVGHERGAARRARDGREGRRHRQHGARSPARAAPARSSSRARSTTTAGARTACSSP